MRPRELDEIEIRVLGALLEKEQTTPDYYPMTVNSLLAACNQKTNRDPVTSLGEEDVHEALDRLRRDVLVWRSEAARSEKWSQSISRRLELDAGGKAILTLLMLRGPQTPGELRARSGRMHDFDGVGEVEETLRSLASDDEPLVVELARRPGQKETRWAQLLGGEIEEEAPGPPVAAAAPRRVPSSEILDRVGALEAAVERLTDELAELTRRLGG
jgi:uncharacterized protein YceH (UPF0502 family)